MKKYVIKKKFIISDDDMAFLKGLPDNLPETRLTQKQKDRIREIYYQYIGRNQVYKGYSRELYLVEQEEKWPSGPRIKMHEAMRIVIGWLVSEQTYHPDMGAEEAASHFFAHLTSREGSQILMRAMYEEAQTPNELLDTLRTVLPFAEMWDGSQNEGQDIEKNEAVEGAKALIERLDPEWMKGFTLEG